MRLVFCKLLTHSLYYFKLQAGTGDEFLDELLSNDASLDEGAVPDIKVMDSSINMSGTEVSSNKGHGHLLYLVYFWWFR